MRCPLRHAARALPSLIVLSTYLIFVFQCSVARWCISKPKIPISVHFRRSCNRRWLLKLVFLLPFCLLYGQMIYILWPIWYIKWSFGIYFLILVYCVKKNLATLVHGRFSNHFLKRGIERRWSKLIKKKFFCFFRFVKFARNSDEANFCFLTRSPKFRGAAEIAPVRSREGENGFSWSQPSEKTIQ
jgi:hypothetical protein